MRLGAVKKMQLHMAQKQKLDELGATGSCWAVPSPLTQSAVTTPTPTPRAHATTRAHAHGPVLDRAVRRPQRRHEAAAVGATGHGTGRRSSRTPIR